MKLSIIMPCFNVATTIERALNSILFQDVNFEYEIILVDDASTDNTIEIVNQYISSFPNITILKNEENSGNAYSFYKGLCASKGEYFCVLDGDDYYTIPDKLQRQVDFLDSDINDEYVGTATQYIIDLGNGMVNIPDRSSYQEFSYVDFLTQHSGYYHTATYMYKNIFRGNVPTQFKDALYRGDTPRTTFHLMLSGKKIKILDFIGSAYTFEFTGIWSGLKQKEQYQFQINYHTQHRENLSTDFEHLAEDKLIEFNKAKMKNVKDEFRQYEAISIDEALMNAQKYAGRFAFGQKDFVLQHAYFSSYIDTLCASLGYIYRIRYPQCIQEEINPNNLCIVNGVLNPHGGGIFAEIEELIDIYHDKEVYLLVTNMESVPSDTIEILSKHSNLKLIYPPENITNRLAWFLVQLKAIAPYRTYFYCSHRDTIGAALAQKGKCENIALFSFDHGYLCGISNANLNTIIAKRPVDYWMLKKIFKDRVIYIPTWNNGATGCKDYKYSPFKDHKNLVTASGAARFYKINGRYPVRYVDLVIELLKNTGGYHYHFGELTEETIKEINDKLTLAGITTDHFIHIPWSDNIPLDLLKRNIDIFIEPFPVVSYKLTLEVLSVGIPIIAQRGLTRMSIADFVPSGTLMWHDEKEFIQLLLSLDRATLLAASKDAIEYFNSYHCTQKVKELLYTNTGLIPDKKLQYPDDTLLDISYSFRLFANDFKISIMKSSIQKSSNNEKRKEDQQKKEKIAREKIRTIRSSYSYQLGFILIFPIRMVVHLFSQVSQFGFKKGLYETTHAPILFYRKSNPEEELKLLSNSVSLKLGLFLTSPFRFIFSRHTRIKQIEEQLRIQQSDITELKKKVR